MLIEVSQKYLVPDFMPASKQFLQLKLAIFCQKLVQLRYLLLIKNGYVPLIHCKLQSVFYDATSWLKDTGVLQKMDDDIWMWYGKRTGEKTHITTTRVLSIKETSLPFALCFLGLMIALVTFMTELCGMNLYSSIFLSYHHPCLFQMYACSY